MVGTQQHVPALRPTMPPAGIAVRVPSSRPMAPSYGFRLPKEAFTSFLEGRARLDAYYAGRAKRRRFAFLAPTDA